VVNSIPSCLNSERESDAIFGKITPSSRFERAANKEGTPFITIIIKMAEAKATNKLSWERIK